MNTFFLRLVSCFIPIKSCRKKFRRNYMDNKYILIKKDGRKIVNPRIKGLKVEFFGRNSVIEICEPCNFSCSQLLIGDNCRVKIEGTKYFIYNLRTNKVMKNNTSLEIGKNLICCGLNVVLDDEPYLSVKIGDNCMIARECTITTSDGHAIFDKNDNLTNPGGDVIVGNHVWIGMRSIILKKSVVPDNSVIGCGSMYTQNSFSNYKPVDSKLGGIFAGMPAKLIKNGVRWSTADPQSLVEW